MEEQHIEKLLQLMNNEGWYYYDHVELSRYLKLKEVCYVLLDGSKVVGCIFTTNFGNQAWLGNIIVEREHRGNGYAQKMIALVIEKLLENGVGTFRLGSVPTAIGLYKHVGFEPESFSTSQVAVLPLNITIENTGLEKNVRVFQPGDIEDVAKLDESFNRSKRLDLLRELHSDSRKKSCLVLEINGDIAGFIMVRQRLASKEKGSFEQGPDNVYRLGPSVVQPKYGIVGFKALFQKAIEHVNYEVKKLDGNSKMYVVFPVNIDKIFQDLVNSNIELDYGDIIRAEPIGKNELQWNYLKSLGFTQEYFEQVMVYTPGRKNTQIKMKETNTTRSDPRGVFASATPGDKQ